MHGEHFIFNVSTCAEDQCSLFTDMLKQSQLRGQMSSFSSRKNIGKHANKVK